MSVGNFDQACTRSSTALPHVVTLVRVTPLFNKKSAFAPLHSDACAAAILLNELDTSLL
jgi:hypothetical protein